jgi:hypothetical protein
MRTNSETTVQCPYCDATALKRGIHSHVFQSDDAAHGERYEVPDDFDAMETEEVGEEEVRLNYPDQVDLGSSYYLDTYTGKAYDGRRGLMIHLSSMGGQDNIPEDVAERHEADDFPRVEIDDDGNITEVLSWGSNDVPPLEPYLPWFNDSERGYIAKADVKELIEEVEDGTGAVTADILREKLL